MLLTFLLLVLTLAQSVLGTDGSYGNVARSAANHLYTSQPRGRGAVC